MIDIIELARTYPNLWVVLDGNQNIVDHGPELPPLRAKHHGSRRTFYLPAAR
ncbi:MAG: hypothetical protein HY078_06605 [Elusimicrobia bacterium]|nr:hypothetical protein [Elusimicrobiota bacterium]